MPHRRPGMSILSRAGTGSELSEGSHRECPLASGNRQAGSLPGVAGAHPPTGRGSTRLCRGGYTEAQGWEAALAGTCSVPDERLSPHSTPPTNGEASVPAGASQQAGGGPEAKKVARVAQLRHSADPPPWWRSPGCAGRQACLLPTSSGPCRASWLRHRPRAEGPGTEGPGTEGGRGTEGFPRTVTRHQGSWRGLEGRGQGRGGGGGGRGTQAGAWEEQSLPSRSRVPSGALVRNPQRSPGYTRRRRQPPTLLGPGPLLRKAGRLRAQLRSCPEPRALRVRAPCPPWLFPRLSGFTRIGTLCGDLLSLDPGGLVGGRPEQRWTNGWTDGWTSAGETSRPGERWRRDLKRCFTSKGFYSARVPPALPVAASRRPDSRVVRSVVNRSPRFWSRHAAGDI